ncbi:MAG: rod-binding protein [Planctomycetota bacterium]
MIDSTSIQGAKLEQSIGLSPQAAKRKEAEDAATSFEQVLVQSLVTELRKSGGADKMFGQGPGADTYAQWFDQVMAERLSADGSFGIADSVLRDLERHNQIAPRATEPRGLGGPRLEPVGAHRVPSKVQVHA